MIKRYCFIFTSFFFVSLVSFSQERGVYFDKKAFKNTPIPVFSKVKKQIPSPIYDAHPEWVDMYWSAWQIGFEKHFRKPEKHSPLVSVWIDDALGDIPYMFQWDLCFNVLFGKYVHHLFPAIESLDNFYAMQHANGMIWRVIQEEDGSEPDWGGGQNYARTVNPPLFSWAEYEYFLFTNDLNRLKRVLPAIEKYAAWVEEVRLCKETPYQLYWNNGQASGMDNTPRDYGKPTYWNETQFQDGIPDANKIERPHIHSSTAQWAWIDMSSQVALQYSSLSKICEALGDKQKAKQYTEKAANISQEINQWMWDEKDAFYYDVNDKGRKIKWKTIASFWPMIAEVSNAEQNQALAKHLFDSSSFWRKTPFPTLAADMPFYAADGKYWQGAVWAPTNYMAIKGLQNAGFDSLSYLATAKYLNALYQVYRDTNTFWECYAPESHSPATEEYSSKLVHKDFIGWTGLGPISLLIENIIGIEVDLPGKEISWTLDSTTRSGIERLKIGNYTVDMIYEPTESIIRINTNASGFALLLKQKSGEKKTFKIAKGKSVLKI